MKTESIIKPPQSKVLKSGRVELLKGEDIGWHVTENREELIIVLNGKATVMLENESHEVLAGDTHYVAEGIKHNVKNNHTEELVYIYVVSLFE